MASGPNGVISGHARRLVEEGSSTEDENVTTLHQLAEEKTVRDHRFNQLPAKYKLVQVELLVLSCFSFPLGNCTSAFIVIFMWNFHHAL